MTWIQQVSTTERALPKQAQQIATEQRQDKSSPRIGETPRIKQDRILKTMGHMNAGMCSKTGGVLKNVLEIGKQIRSLEKLTKVLSCC